MSSVDFLISVTSHYVCPQKESEARLHQIKTGEKPDESNLPDSDTSGIKRGAADSEEVVSFASFNLVSKLKGYLF